MKGMFRSVLLSVLLVASGLVMLFGTDSLSLAQGQTQPYVADWQARQLYRVKFTSGTGTIFYGPQIGVSRWTVGGRINNGRITYEETWEGPSAQYINFSAVGRCASNFDRNRWIAGCFNAGSGSSTTVDLEKIDLNVISDQNCNSASSSSVPDQRASGNAAACKRNFGSSYTVGAYGFNFSSSNYSVSPTDINNDFKLHYTAIPLQWTVTGTITYNP